MLVRLPRNRSALRRHVIHVALVGLVLGCDLGLTPFVDDAGVDGPLDGGFDALVPEPPRDGTIPADAADANVGVDVGVDAGARSRVFVTKATVPGTFGGLAAADTACQKAAQAGGLPGTYIAWLSVAGTSAVSRIKDVGPWYLVNRAALVFSTRAAIPVGPHVAIDHDESGNVVQAGEVRVWTGTLATGEAAPNHCVSYTSPAGSSQFGVLDKTGPAWTDNGGIGCSTSLHLYCLEQ